jgi:endoglucanase
MRKFTNVWIIILLTTICFAASCGKDEPAPTPELIVSTTELTMDKNGGTGFFHIKSNTPWTVSSSEVWCTAAPLSGVAGTTKVEVLSTENETTSERIALITIDAGSESRQVTIRQEKSFLLTVGQTEYIAETAGDQIEIDVQSSGSYTVNISEDWITPIEGSETTKPKFTVAGHPGLIDRSATITFSLQDITRTVTISQAGNQLSVPADNSGMESDAMTLVTKMRAGWNLGNSLEATGVTNGVYTAGETLWGNPATTKTLIDAVKAAGFNSIRIPCAWSGYVEDEETYKIKDSWLSRVKEVVDYCVENDMYAIINIHWDGGWLENNPTYSQQVAVNKKQKALWEQIAVAFRNYDEHLLFAGTNEVHAEGNPTAENFEVQMSYNQTFVDAVRSTGGKNAFRNLAVQGYVTNIQYAYDHLVMPTDNISNRQIVEVHYYDPWDFCGLEQDASWATVKYFWGAPYAGNPRTSDWGQEAWVNEAFGKMKTKFVDNGIPVIIGEYGPTLRSNLTTELADHIASRNYYLQYVTQAAKDNGLVPFYWDNGNTGNLGSGLFNRVNGAQVHVDAINAITSVFK